MGNADQKRKLEFKTGDWVVRVKVWQSLAKTPNNLSAAIRELEYHSGEEGYPEHVPDKATIKKIRDELANMSPELVFTLPLEVQVYAQELNLQLREELERLKAGSKLTMKGEQVPYVETRHKKKMRELARSLQRELGLPHILEIFLRPGRNTVALSMDQEENHLYRGLRSHLKTGGFSEVLYQIREWKDSAGEYLIKCNDLLKIVRGEIPNDVAIVPPDGEAKPGLIVDDFCGTICAHVVGQVTGNPTTLGYKTKRHSLNPDLWVLRYGAYGVYIGQTKEELERYQDMHKDLITKYASNPLTRDMPTIWEKLSEIRGQINRQLQIFSDMEHLPGRCELC